MKVKLHDLQGHVQVLQEETQALRRQKINDDEKLRRYHNEIEQLKTQQAHEQRQVQLLQEQVRKFHALPNIIYRSVHYFLRELDHVQDSAPFRSE